ncbi:LytR/AlgR family response regulator transcription factor [Hymenobacter caeli]|uniref:DNA-binding LytR/AlgR family response regulator n=1 Tax=Hymenobacter caeli TaxID=2735894 RepID=A0ABX2FU88_9BACT|nr:LytTR family DNA-binding domain-containing protein [Hymenobacter caeli]NRT20760.1 DNA-binding LytR/AlgR family response regulator [Hymenobacter caeli]
MATPPTEPLLTCLVVDDDPLSVQVVLNCIANTPFLTAAGSFTDPAAAADFLRTQTVDLLFLDVEMPLLSGIELLDTLQHPPLTVLITSSKDYAVEAFEHAVVDYLVKPVSYARFLQAAQNALAVAQKHDKSLTHSDFAFVKVDSRLVRVDFDEVRYVEALGDYVHIITTHSKHIVYSTMRAVADKFPAARFVRVHRSFIVNLQHVQAVEDGAVVVDGKHIPVGQTYARDVMQRVNKL